MMMVKFNKKFMTLFFLCSFSCVIFVIVKKIFFKPPLFLHSPVEAPTDKPACITSNSKQDIDALVIKSSYKTPACADITHKITNGFWVERDYDTVDNDNILLDELMAEFRIRHEGFSKHPVREDGRCGFQQPAYDKVSFDASAWCDPRGNKPCCSNKQRGTCISESECILSNTVNLATYLHAELSDWVLRDQSCQMVIYDQQSACALFRDKQVKHIAVVGNSLMRNMYSQSLQLLTNNFYNGSIKGCVSPSLREKCVNQWQNIDKFCLGLAMAPSSDELPGAGLCNGHSDFLIEYPEFFEANDGGNFLKYVSDRLDETGFYIIAGIGIHNRFNSTKVIDSYLRPVLKTLEEHHWPKLLWMHQVRTGIFKPPRYIEMHGTDEDIDRYVEEMDRFCKSYNVPTLDLRALSTNVWSVDGTHYGSGVNLMKVQMFLNLIASGQVF